MVVATRRGAVPIQHRRRAEFIFRIERQLRLGMRLVQQRLHLPAALSVWAGALVVWRRFSAEPGFDQDSVEEQAPVFVDCLLAVTAPRVLRMDSSESLFYEGNRLLYADLKVRHEDDIFDCIEHDLTVYWQSQASDSVSLRATYEPSRE